MNIDKIFSGMSEATSGRAKDYMGYGKFVVQLEELLAKDSEKDGVPLFVCRFTIVETDNPAHPVGSSGSWTLKGEPLQYGKGDIKALILSVLGLDPSKVAVGSEENALAVLLFRFVLGSETARKEMAALPPDQRVEADFYVGQRVRLETKAKSETNAFTRHFWSPLPKAA